MTTLQFSAMRTFLSENQFDINTNPISSDLICILCHRVMVNACQGSCGCCYCYKCINYFVTNIGKYCPGKTSNCMKEKLIVDTNVQRNENLNQIIAGLEVECLTCHSKVQLGSVVEHRESCVVVSGGCPSVTVGYGNTVTCNGDVEMNFNTALQDNLRMMVDLISNMRQEIDALKDQAKVNELIIETLKEESRENKTELLMLKKELENMSIGLKINETEVSLLPQQLEGDQDTESVSVEDFPETEIKESDKEKVVLGLEIRRLKKELINLREKNKIDVENNNGSLNKLQLSYNELKKEIHDLRKFEYVWRVDSVSRVFQWSGVGKKGVYSDAFYTGHHGYRMQLCMYRRKYEGGKYLVIYMSFVQGVFDNVLRWPFMGTVTLSVIDQYKGESQFEFVANRDSTPSDCIFAFQRPTKKTVEGYGYDIEVKELVKFPGAVVNNSVFVRCVVTFTDCSHS